MGKTAVQKEIDGDDRSLETRIYQSAIYSPNILKSYDRNRHISLNDAYGLIKSQEDPHLSVDKLSSAVDSGQINVYEFNNEKYFDRFDIGRVYHSKKEKKEGLVINRHFTDGQTNPFETVGPYEKRHLKITDYKSGNVKFEMEDAEFPLSWDDHDANIVADKYFYKPKKDEWKEKIKQKIGKDHEYSPVHLIRRVTNFITDEGWKLGYFKTDGDREAFRDELAFIQINRMFAFNSPVQFNAGLFNEYGIKGSPGINYFRNPETGDVAKIEEGCNIKPQCHACFIKGPKDNLESIMMHAVDEGGIFSSGSGIGQDIGALRGEGEPLSGGGKASGPMSFFKIYDDSAGAIKSGGKSRRAARMTTMRYHHPDIMKFIRAKPNEDKKALILMKAGYSGGMDGEAYTTVTFQNTNLSVRLDDEFFEKLNNDEEVELRRVTDGKVIGKVSAKRMLQEISFGSWRIGDPAVQYESKIQEMHTTKNSGMIDSSNPCSEYMHQNDTSCNLGSSNLLAFTDQSGNFDVNRFQQVNRIASISLDIINDAASYPVRDIAMISPEFRTIGLGYANLGAWLMRRGISYHSEEGRALAAAVTAVMTGNAYDISAEMADKLGTFTNFEFNKKPIIEVMRKHKKSLDDIVWDDVPSDLKDAAYNAWENVVRKGELFGFRNAQATVLAPTGTISYLMGCDTTGVEPSYELETYKNLAGGGTLKLTIREVPNALRNLGYDEKQISDVLTFVSEENTVNGAPHVSPEHYEIFDTAVGNGNGAGFIPFEGHIKMLGATQPFISGAISKTNNLPEEATVRNIYDGYLLGYKLGLKALAIFRDKSKPISALGLGKDFAELKRGQKEELPARRNVFESEVTIGGTPFHVLASEYEDGRPGQVAFFSYTSGSTLKAMLETHGILASKALKRGVDLEDVASAWLGQEFEPRGLVSGHPSIKMALSPLDYAAKFLLLEYQGKTELAENKDGLKFEELRGAKNGAFKTYEGMAIDDWDIEQVLRSPELGGFIEKKSKNTESISEKQDESKNKNGKKTNNRGVTCNSCGRIMRQISPGCWECGGCAEKIGGCGL